MGSNNQSSELSYGNLLQSLYRTMYAREAPEEQIKNNIDQINEYKIDLDSIIYSFSNSPERLEIENRRSLDKLNADLHNTGDFIFSKNIEFFDQRGIINDLGSRNLTSKYELLEKFKTTANTNVFMDVGANVGQTMVEAFAFDKSVKYFGFEPNPASFRYLKTVAEANALNATLFPWACSNIFGPLKLYTLSSLDTSATTRPETRQNMYNEGNGHWIASYPIDTISKMLPLEDNFILKIDVEGAELNVLSGAAQTIEKYRPLIICEVLNSHSTEEIEINDQNKSNIETICNNLRYNIYQQIFAQDDFYGDGRLLGLKLIAEFPKSRLYIDYRSSNDYVFVPEEFGDVSFSV